MKKISRLALSLIGLLFAVGFLLALEAQVQGTSTGPVVFGDIVGVGQIIQAVQPSTRTNAYGIALGDVDGDGDLDILTGSDAAAANELLVWENPLTGTHPFSATGWISNAVGTTPDHVNAVAMADLDNDGDVDAVSAHHAGGGAQIRIWQNDGTPFTGQWTVNATVGTLHDNIVRVLVIADLDRDGALDVAAASDNAAGGAEIVAWRNPGDPFAMAWTAQDIGTVNVDVYSLATGDLDRDGDLDLVCGTRASVTGLVIGWQNPWNGGGGDPFASSWSSATLGTTPSTNHVLDIAIGDLDRDGDLDMATVGTTGVLRLWENDSTPFTGTWSGTDLVTPAGPYSVTEDLGQVAVVDLDHDGYLDIVTGIGGIGAHQSTETYKVIAWLNRGDPFSANWTRLDIGDTGSGSVCDLAVGDMDNDGDVDVATVNALWSEYQVTAWANGIAAHRGQYVGGEVTLGDTDEPVYAIAVGDLDRDGDLDLVSSGMLVWNNLYTATFSSPWMSATLAAGVRAQDVAIHDLDQDGDLDVVAGGNFGLAIWQNPWDQGNSTPFGTWPVSHVLTTAQMVKAVVVADLDNDGWLDIAAARDDGLGSGDLTVWQNPHSVAGVWASNLITSVQGILTVIAGDVDRDGWTDLATGSGYLSPYAQEIRVWQNDRSPFSGTWASNQVVHIVDDVRSVTLADLDNDGRLDIVARYDELTWGRIGMWRNPDTPFSTPWTMSVTMNAGARVARVAVGDLDHDGDVDVVSADFASSSPPDGGVQWWQNDGSPFDGSWSYAQTWGTGIGFYDLLLADLNKNGDLDTLVSGKTASERGKIVTWVALWQRVYLPVVLR